MPPVPVLLIQHTSNGKFLVRDTCTIGVSRVHWSMPPLLALTADQTAKLDAKAINTNGSIVGLCRDACRDDESRKHIVSSLPALLVDTSAMVTCFSLPQATWDCAPQNKLFNTITNCTDSNKGHKLKA